MTTGEQVPSASGLTHGVVARVGQIGVMFVVIAVVLFGSAGTLDWAWGRVYLGIYVASVSLNAWFLRHSQALVAERGRPAASAPGWDSALGGLWAIAEFVAIPFFAGLDLRWGWTGSVAVGVHVVGAVVFAIGLGLFGWAMITNAWFSTAARIQPERSQQVCRDGPYRFVRHPGYVGAVLQSVGSPLLLGSVVAIAPALVAITCMVVRTSLEDRMLHAGLPGYADYARDVRRRLMPLVW
jgi:protein-S-isoprenylcysteine O-methyltransferase Ste14